MLRPLQPELKAEIRKATLHFHHSLPGSPGMAYLESRGIGPNTAKRLGLGYVDPENPLEGWERFRGRISIPYLNMAQDPVWIKFRAVPEVLGPDVDKMAQQAGGGTRLYNTIALSAPGDTLCLAEGEFDVITLTALGLAAVGIPGASSWKEHFHRALDGYQRVVLFYDDDKAGRDLVKTVQAKMPDIIPIAAPREHNDIGAAYQAGLGPQIVALATGVAVPDNGKVLIEDGQSDPEGEQGESRQIESGDRGVVLPADPPGPDGASGTGEPGLNPHDGISNPDADIPF